MPVFQAASSERFAAAVSGTRAFPVLRQSGNVRRLEGTQGVTVLGVPADELQSTRKSASATVPRMLVMFLARKWTRAALSEISRTLGRKSHSTVISAEHKVTDWLACGKTVSLAYGQCKIEDAIKRIETQLRVG